jgi:GntR family transcriptional regulator, transcriptional repressor for pyruvate dehydrogenase complex
MDEKQEPNTNTMANALADRIHADIAASELQEDELFMTGDQVVEHYEVSRSVARDAVSQLRALGVLKSRQRKGLLVARPDPVRLMERWVPFYGRGCEGKELEGLAQLRYVLEMGAADLAVSQASDGQIAELKGLADDFEAIAARFGHNEDADRVDLSYHTLILEMTGNDLIVGMHRVLSDYFLASTTAAPMPREDPVSAVRTHHMIAEALERRDREMVRALLRSHLERTLDE